MKLKKASRETNLLSREAFLQESHNGVCGASSGGGPGGSRIIAQGARASTNHNRARGLYMNHATCCLYTNHTTGCVVVVLVLCHTVEFRARELLVTLTQASRETNLVSREALFTFT